MEFHAVRRRDRNPVSRQPIPLPDQISGYRSSVINQIRDYLISITPADSPFLHWIRRPDGLFPVLNQDLLLSSMPKEPFELYEITGLGFKIRGEHPGASGGAVWIAGQAVTITEDAGNDKAELDTALEIEDTSWVYLKVSDIAGSGIEASFFVTEDEQSSSDDPGSTITYLPWYYLECTGTPDKVISGVWDLRRGYVDTRMGN